MMKSRIYKKILIRNAFLCVILFTLFVLASCGGDDDNSTAIPENVHIRFSIDRSGDGLTRASQNSSVVKTYEMNAVGGSKFQLSVTETDVFPEIMEGTGATTRGLPVESVGAMSDFTTYCFDETGKAYYENIAADNNGQLKEQKVWPHGNPLHFYAIHPYDAEKGSFVPSPTDFRYTYHVSTTVEQQADLMYASTGVVPFNTDGLARLHFHHALAAIIVKVGSVGANITKVNSVTFKNVHSKGTLTLPASDGTATWTLDNGTESVKDYAITELNQTSLSQETVLNPKEKTFLMLPQSLDTVMLEIEVTLSDGTTSLISQSLAGENAWVAGKARTYKVSLY